MTYVLTALNIGQAYLRIMMEMAAEMLMKIITMITIHF
jgi:hypothetical protein